MSPDLALCLTLISSHYPCLEQIFMVTNVFEPLQFYCMYIFIAFQLANSVEPIQTPHSSAFEQGRNYLHIGLPVFKVPVTLSRF